VAAGSFYSQDIAWAEKNLTFSANNVYSTRALAQSNPLGEPSPIALEDIIVLSDSPGGPGPLIEQADFESLIQNLQGGPKHAKMIMWQGGADQQIFWQNSVEAYREVATLFGNGRTDFKGLQSWFRYYHAPGVGHCGGGVGATPSTVLPDGQTQIFDDLVKWVEEGVVPQSAGDSTHMGILATGPGSFGTRPICPWPTTAIYTGTGSAAVASNYICGGDLDADNWQTDGVPVKCQGLRTPFSKESSNELNYNRQGLTPGQCQDQHGRSAER
jgi:Tannase and feruloyl esterase